MKWCQNVYVTDDVADKKRKILHRLRAGKLQFNIYVIILPLGDDGIMEIYPSYIFLQKIYKRQPLYVIGLASGRESAYELAVKIALECYSKNKDFDIRKFIRERQGGLS